MNVWDAIHKGRELSEKNIPFSFTYMSCNLTEHTSEGVVEVHHARFLTRETNKHHKNADIIERYLDLDTMQPRRFYQPLLMTFNGEKTEL